MAVIRACIENGNNLNAAQVVERVNMIFSNNGLKTISRARIHDIISENEHLFTAARNGRQKYDTDVAMGVKRRAPEWPLYYWTLDGWTVELGYKEDGAYKRMVAVIVLDAMNKYPVGYAIGDRENTDLIRDALRNAIMHMKDLYGGYYRPLQLQSDNYQIKNLTPFYQAVAHLYVPARVKNAKAKVIEPYFAYLNKQYCQRLFPNWTGFNLNSDKDNQVNSERLNKIKHTFADRAGVTRQIDMIMAMERKAKGQVFMEKWAVTPRKECLNDMDWLMVFGKPLGKTNRITGQGIEKQVNGMKYFYDCFDPAFRANMSVDWQLIGDEYDMSKVLAVSPDDKMRFVLETKRIVPMDRYSMTDEDHDYLKRIEEFNDARMDEVAAQYGRDADMAREIVMNTPMGMNDDEELALKAMFIVNGQQKERLQDAKRLNAKALKGALKKEQKTIEIAERTEVNDWHARQDAYMQSLVDFNEYENI